MRTLIALVCCLAGATMLLTAQGKPPLSPRDSVSLSLDTNTISVNYGRPSMRGRKIMGGLVPWNQVWRTGANEATHLRTNFDLTFGTIPLPRGRYTLWTIPSRTGWTVIVNKQTGQWGTAYDERQDLARFDAKAETLPAPVDTFTIRLERTGTSSGVLRLLWENTGVSVPFEKNDHIRPISPNDSATTSIAGQRMVIRYGRPYMRGRHIWGVVVPMDSIWRTGAGRATWLTTDIDLHNEAGIVPAGSYTIYSLPTRQSYTLIISKKPGGGDPAYDPREDLVRITMKEERPTETIDQFHIWLEPSGDRTVMLRLGWADRVYSTSFSVK